MCVCPHHRVRVRLHEKLSELAPFQKEVERHMGLLSSQLLSVVSGTLRYEHYRY